MKKRILLIISVFAVVLSACNDVIDFNSPSSGVSQLAIDAWITDEPGKVQSISLTLTQPYFEKTQPKPALKATVFVADEDSVLFEFKDLKNNGVYVWSPKNKSDKILQVGKRYGLYVAYEGEEYISVSQTNRVPKIDSITYSEESNPFASDTSARKGYFAEFFGRDFSGANDTYWVRSYLNDTLRNKPNSIQLAWDAANSPANSFDGGMFIVPVRQSINEFGSLLKHNDKIKVEIFSIPNEAFYFLSLVRQASQDGGLFSVPQSNIPSNIQNRKEKGKLPLGFFCTSAVSKDSTVIDRKKAKKSIRG